MSLPATQIALDIQRQVATEAADRERLPSSSARIVPIFEEEHCTKSSLLGTLEHRFDFNGESYSLESEINWLQNPSQDIEWHILLHKFYYAPGLARQYSLTADRKYIECFESLVRSWISQTPVGYIAADVTARRVQNWLYAVWIFRQHEASFSAAFERDILQSLAAQVEFICENLATKRNHRTLGLYAIFLASIVISDCPRASHWRELSVREMLNNIEDDLLDDGVHCELSTDYHHIVLRSYLLFLRLAALNDIALPDSVRSKLSRALDFALFVHRPDGNIPALSDSDSRSFLELLEWGARLFARQDYAFAASQGALGSAPATQHKVFPDSGYVVLRSEWQAGSRFRNARYLVFDSGPVGEGNHGHLDALNIELAAFGRSLVVDPGRYTYDEQGSYNWRAHFRQTRAHNTVLVNGCDQAVYRQRGPKRNIYKPHPECRLVRSDLGDDMAYLHGVVVSPNYRALHHRHIWFVDNRYWVILDRLLAPDPHDYELRFQLSADAMGQVDREILDGGTRISAPGLALFVAQREPCVAEELAFVSSSYGTKTAAPRICAQATAADYCFLSILYPTRIRSPRIAASHVGSVADVTLDNGVRRDRWQWNSDRNVMMRRSVDGVQTWRVHEENSRG